MAVACLKRKSREKCHSSPASSCWKIFNFRTAERDAEKWHKQPNQSSNLDLKKVSQPSVDSLTIICLLAFLLLVVSRFGKCLRVEWSEWNDAHLVSSLGPNEFRVDWDFNELSRCFLCCAFAMLLFCGRETCLMLVQRFMLRRWCWMFGWMFSSLSNGNLRLLSHTAGENPKSIPRNYNTRWETDENARR